MKVGRTRNQRRAPSILRKNVCEDAQGFKDGSRKRGRWNEERGPRPFGQPHLVGKNRIDKEGRGGWGERHCISGETTGRELVGSGGRLKERRRVRGGRTFEDQRSSRPAPVRDA